MKDDKELIFASDHPPATLNSWEKRGVIRRLARGIYSRIPANVASDEQLIRRNWRDVAAHLTPGAVITDRSARTGQPVDDTLYLAHTTTRRISLPGLTIDTRAGAVAQPGDIPTPGGLYLASRERGLAENSTLSRARGGRPGRTLTESELGDWVDELASRDPEKLAGIRERAEALAPALGVNNDHLRTVARQIGAAIGTQQVPTASAALSSRQARVPYDQERIARLDVLRDALRKSAPQHHPIDARNRERYAFQPFFEAYFSNYIEGTEFAVDVAADIVFEGFIPPGRPEDAHDVIGTYQAVTNTMLMGRSPDSAAEFIEILCEQHKTIMGGRPDKRPGQFKELANQVGNTRFVDPPLVVGTLVEGFARLCDLDTGFERAVFTMFLVAEAHPFDDGNGRVARVMMNSQLDQVGDNRIILPTVLRTDYLNGLRRLSRSDDPSILIKSLRYAHDYTHAIDFNEFDSSVAQLTATNAFEDSESGVHLIIPTSSTIDIELSHARPQGTGGDATPVRRYRRADGTIVGGHGRDRPTT